MKKTLLIAGALLALTATASFAGGLNLSWSDCGSFGSLQKNSACTSNTAAPSVMVGSAIAPVPVGLLNGAEIVLDMQTNQATLSSWWQFASGGCRAGAMTGSFDFSSGPFNCADVWAGGASGGLSTTPGFNGPNRERIRLVCAIPGQTSIDNVTENYYFKVTINNSKTTGTGACAGCLDGACIVLNSILLTEPLGVGDFLVSNPALRQYVQWQSGAANVAGGCPQATPTRNATWGSVKSLYR